MSHASSTNIHTARPPRRSRTRVLISLITVVAVLSTATASLSAQASYGQIVRNLTYRNTTGGGLYVSDLVANIIGDDTPFSNAFYRGDPLQLGTFSGFQRIGFASGVVLSTGIVSSVVGTDDNTHWGYGKVGRPWANGSAVIGPNLSAKTQINFDIPGDDDLSRIIENMTPYAQPTKDAATLEFDFVPKTDLVTMDFIFASDGYGNFVYPDPTRSNFYGAFGILVNGVNCATVGPDKQIINVNTVNNLRLSSYYRDNPVITGTGESRYDTGFNGLTTVITCSAAVNPGVSNHMKIGVADVWYGGDHGVFIGQGTFSSSNGKGGGPEPTLSYLNLDKGTTQVDTNITAQVTVNDKDGYPLSGETVHFTKKSADVRLSRTSCVTDGDGQCSATVTSSVAGLYADEIAATVTAAGRPAQVVGSPATVEFTPASPMPTPTVGPSATATVVPTETATPTESPTAGPSVLPTATSSPLIQWYQTKTSLFIRVGPGTSYPSIGSLPARTNVSFDCYTYGTVVSGDAEWGHIAGNGGFLADYYIDAGGKTLSQMGLPRCADHGPRMVLTTSGEYVPIYHLTWVSPGQATGYITKTVKAGSTLTIDCWLDGRRDDTGATTWGCLGDIEGGCTWVAQNYLSIGNWTLEGLGVPQCG